ncbi:hypothetical protein D9613_001999 [Agrocybe pediades]|uniref:Histone deacetylase complex subunit SAP30 Sin3 binding domain-containing protein n=1 Tax=Agrocybe pediades TaxID=84607 RepID=A0A8H4VV14_9AGAR|nr:hypothetical protein D9613_001999 [Agrocybe pediades]KAF9569785.1 hypothetical protein CPC08DRAFT_701660 [Agrocybe pediades]
MSTTGQSNSRSRTQARKKASDDAPYFGPPSANAGPSSLKRQAADKAEGEPRVKRKRTEITNASMVAGKKDVVESEPRKSLVEFQKLPTSTLQRYLVQYDIVPRIYPSPLTVEDPPAPSFLADPELQHARAPSPPALTPANRPRRDPKDSQTRRRSSRLLEEEPRTRVPILADVAELHNVLAGIVEQHFKEVSSVTGREELDTLSAFMAAVEKSKGAKSAGIAT